MDKKLKQIKKKLSKRSNILKVFLTMMGYFFGFYQNGVRLKKLQI